MVSRYCRKYEELRFHMYSFHTFCLLMKLEPASYDAGVERKKARFLKSMMNSCNYANAFVLRYAFYVL